MNTANYCTHRLILFTQVVLYIIKREKRKEYIFLGVKGRMPPHQ